MAEGSPKPDVPDVPTGPTEEQPGTHPAAAGQGSGERLAGRAEEILPELDIEWHFDRGSDSGSPLAGLLAAAAATPQPLDARGYREYLDSHDGEWPTVEELESHYGSFSAALEAAGIDVPGRSIT